MTGTVDDGRQPVTIYDVARAAGVAPSTVSRAFSRPGRVNSETAARIRRIADELGYRTAPPTRARAISRTRLLALVVSDVANPFYAEIIHGAQAAATAEGYALLLIDAHESERLERSTLERTLPLVDGVLLAGTRLSDSAIRMLSKQKPVIVLNRTIVDVPSVVPDNARGIRLAVQHLADLGHQSVTYLSGPEASWADGSRWRAVLESATALSLRARRVGPFAPDLTGGTHAAEELSVRLPSAVIAFNDQLAIGLIRGLTAHGVRVPRDVSVVGFDNISLSGLITPGLTTVAAPLHTEGATATRHLMTLVASGQRGTILSAVLPVRLIVRGSTGRRGRRRSIPVPPVPPTTDAPD
ncbi:LacI family DNA-binding transcriptional regulator [Modestobacter sp. VKM Ac-2984]|uniref:LacI family DNA-binding transcriptional regulator n=1 Tax=Modestobacter sp. VKM Ac-2984 TaxID=3004138 RepID=UPI0022AA9B01|nr:LacI family DNA-binding transcriptional regulator [Modestobacter sp. VKM Ac-2984]MCZ2816333.1 LacI family DNA-binding transcriptional regulator [Modestobacter sp. VKM Ac-2984]